MAMSFPFQDQVQVSERRDECRAAMKAALPHAHQIELFFDAAYPLETIRHEVLARIHFKEHKITISVCQDHDFMYVGELFTPQFFVSQDAILAMDVIKKFKDCWYEELDDLITGGLAFPDTMTKEAIMEKVSLEDARRMYVKNILPNYSE